MVRSFRDLQVWQRGMTLVEDVYRVSAAASVPSIAEGHSRTSRKEYLKPISIAQGSLAEVQTLLLETASSLTRQLHALRGSLEQE